MQLLPWTRDWRKAGGDRDYLEVNLITSDERLFPVVLLPNTQERSAMLGGKLWAHVQRQMTDGIILAEGYRLDDLEVIHRTCGGKDYYGVFILRAGVKVVDTYRPWESIVVGIGSNGREYQPIH
jgi:hypothetical protein